MENCAFLLIALCGFLAGSSARINANSVIQRGPNLFWLIPAIAMGAAALAWDVVNITTFLIANTMSFSSALLFGSLVAFVFRAETSATSD